METSSEQNNYQILLDAFLHSPRLAKRDIIQYLRHRLEHPARYYENDYERHHQHKPFQGELHRETEGEFLEELIDHLEHLTSSQQVRQAFIEHYQHSNLISISQIEFEQILMDLLAVQPFPAD